MKAGRKHRSIRSRSESVIMTRTSTICQLAWEAVKTVRNPLQSSALAEAVVDLAAAVFLRHPCEQSLVNCSEGRRAQLALN